MVLHHGLAAADEAVHQRGLAHVRAANDGDRRQRFGDHVGLSDAVLGLELCPLILGQLVVGVVALAKVRFAELGLVNAGVLEALQVLYSVEVLVLVVLGAVGANHVRIHVRVAGTVDAGLDELGFRLEVLAVGVAVALAHRALLSTTSVSAARTSSGVISEVSTSTASSAGLSGLVAREESAWSRRCTSASTAS